MFSFPQRRQKEEFLWPLYDGDFFSFHTGEVVVGTHHLDMQQDAKNVALENLKAYT